MDWRKTGIFSVWRALSGPLLVVCASLLAGCAFLEEEFGIITGASIPAYEGSSIASNNHPVQEGGGMVDIQGPPLEDALGDLPATPPSEVAPRTDYPDKASAEASGTPERPRMRLNFDARQEPGAGVTLGARKRATYEPPNDASAHAYLAAVRVGLPTYKYLGTELGGIINLDNGYRLQDDESSIGGGIGGSFGIGTYAGQRFRFNLNIGRSEVEVSGPRGGFDPGLGTTLLIPGTGYGPSGAGYSLASFGGLNVVTASDYSLDYKQTSFTGKISTDCWCDDEDEEGGFGFSPYLGFTYGRTSFDQSFGGDIPGFGATFRYDTDMTNNAWGVMFGGQAMKPIRNSPVMLRAGATGQVDFNRAKGTDRLDFSLDAPQAMAIKNNDTTFSYTANAGVTVGAEAPIRFDLDLFYGGIGNTPSIVRDGVGPSRIEFENSDFYGTSLRTTLRF